MLYFYEEWYKICNSSHSGYYSDRNSEGVGKDDANAGIIIVNTGKKIVDISFSQNLGIDKQKVNKIVEELKNRKTTKSPL